jgi:tRNA dimethylallyltransferase
VQLYCDLPILTARPAAAELARAAHRLYGLLEARETASVAGWLARAEPLLVELATARRLAIVTGGTGLYFKALLEGLPVMPDIPAELRSELRRSGTATARLHAELAALDPLLAGRLAPGDRQRILRGLEVVRATGRPLSEWQADPRPRPQLAAPVVGVALLPPPAVVDGRIAARLDGMLAAGLLDELAAFRAGPGRGPTALAKADGVAEFGAYLDGIATLEAARQRTVLKVRRYAKRQRTFFRGQLSHRLPVVAGIADATALPSLVERVMRALDESSSK